MILYKTENMFDTDNLKKRQGQISTEQTNDSNGNSEELEDTTIDENELNNQLSSAVDDTVQAHNQDDDTEKKTN